MPRFGVSGVFAGAAGSLFARQVARPGLQLVSLATPVILLAWVCTVAATPALAAVYTVSAGGAPGWTNLQNVINSAGDGDEIRIQGGLTLIGNGAELRVTNQLAIGGGWDASFAAQDSAVHGSTVLNANGQSRVFNLSAKSLLSCLEITGGQVVDSGAGINVAAAAAGSRLSYLSIHNNGTLTSVTTGGGGIYSAAAIGVFNSIIYSNRVSDFGGGICVNASASALVFGSLFYANAQGKVDPYSRGNAAYCGGSAPYYLVNCTFADNTTASGFGFSGSDPSKTNAVFRNTILSRNGASLEVRMANGAAATWIVGNCVMDTYSIHSAITRIYDAGTTNPTADPGFIDRVVQNFDLNTNSVALELGGFLLGTTLSGNPVTFVDVNNNGTYQALTDVIVRTGSYSPGALDHQNHYIYTRDLAGRPRLSGVTGRTIDAGPYQKLRPNKGTVVVFK